MPVPTRTIRRSRQGAAFVAAGALTAGLFVGIPASASAAAPLSIATIQGTARFSPYVGKVVTTKPSVVTAAYPTGGLGGFVVQTPGSGGKKRSLKKASDAVFVYTGKAGVDVHVGDLVSVTGTVEEFPSSTDPETDSLTEIGGSVKVVRSSASYKKVKPVSGISWASTYDRRENLESMLFSDTEKWTVNDTYSLGSYGELGLATGGRLVEPTDKARFGSKAADKQADRNAERRVVLNDGISTPAFDKAGSPGTPPYLTRKKDVKVGDTARLTEPVVVDWRNGAWTFNPTRPTVAGDEVATIKDKASEKVPNVKGDVSVASFNVLNYFTTLGSKTAGCKPNPVSSDGTPNTVASGCDARGAWDAADLDRQQTKIVKAINALDSSVTGLMEIENSVKLGDKKDEATATLVAALNKAAGRAKWDYVPSSDQLQPVADQDVITNAIIFQPAEVTWAGRSYADGEDATDAGPFGNARTPIAAAFTPVGGGAPVLVGVNHFKSKGSAPDDPADPNADQGQGAWNEARVAQAQSLLGWVKDLQNETRIEAVALVGDFNSYTHEDPLETLYSAGWTNAAKQKDYSYNFDGLSGSLDHVLLNPAADKRLTGSGVWNINSIEPVLREYSRYKSTDVDYYLDGVQRASDHDPVKVGLKKGKARETTITMLNINDFHGRIAASRPDTKQFFGTIEQQRAAAGDGNTLVLSAGDNIGASLFASSVQKDQPTIDVLNAAGLDASAIGNHELDRGFSDLVGRVQKAADWTYLGANVYKKGTTKPMLPTYAIVKRGGLKVGIVGAVTQETPTLVSPAGIAGLDFGDPVTAVNRVTKQLTDGKKSNGEADVVVAEYHEGAPNTQLDATGAEVVSLADQLKASPVFAHLVLDTSPKVAAIFTGHTHQAYAYDAPVPGRAGATRPVTQTGSYAGFVTKVTLTVDTKTKAVRAHTQQNVAVTKVPDADLVAAYPRVKRIAGIVDAALARSDELGSVKVGEATHEITRAFGTDGVDSRSRESTLSDLVAEMYRSSTASPERGSAQIGVQNPGGVREDLDQGTVTFGEAASVLPFANSLFTVDLTGAQFKTLLEQQWQTPAAGETPSSEPTLQLGLSKNVTYTFDATQAQGGRITSIAVGGKAIDPAATYRVATNSFLATGGDNFRVFTEGRNAKDTGLSDLDAWTDYIKAQSPVSPSFAKQAVAVSPLPSTLTAGRSTGVTLSALDFSSRPAADGDYAGTDETTSTVTATLNGSTIGTGTATEGSATVDLAVPAGATKGAGTLVLTTNTGTTVTIPVTVG